MAGKRFSLWLCIWTLTLDILCFPAALAMTLEEPQPDREVPAGNTYRLTLDARVVGSGETLSYETVAPELAGNPFAAEYYPGELTVEVIGQVVIESGGCLTIGTLSSGNEKEQSPVLQGSRSPDGLIVVRAGGSLILKNVSFSLDGEGFLIVQEPGGSVELTDMEPEPGLISWAPPVVNNAYQQPADLWLEEGVALTGSMPPDTLDTYLQYQGAQQWKSFTLRWNIDPLDGQTQGEAALMGAFLDENGETLASVRPLTLTVHWYEPGRLVVTDTAWLGQSAASAKLKLKELPEEAVEVWGEVSADGGETWTRWEQFQCREEENSVTCIFSLSDSSPRHFRVRAVNEREHLYWATEAVLLPKEETEPADQGGNRGGSTSVVRPTRTPTPPLPTPTPIPTSTPAPTPVPTLSTEPIPSQVPAVVSAEPTATSTLPPEPTAEVLQIPAPTPAAEPLPSSSAGHGALDMPPDSSPKAVHPPAPTARPTFTPVPSAEPSAMPVPTPSADVPPASMPAPEPLPAPGAGGLPTAVQILLVLLGGGVCALAGVLVTKRKR